jgi:dihydroxyacetone kinase-like protein
MELTKENAQSFLLYLCEEMPKQEKRFCELDSVVGDGDHGVTITRGFTAAKEAVSSCNGTPEDLFAEMGDAMMAAMGGAIGPIYGTLFRAFSQAVSGKSRLSTEGLGDMFQQGLEEIKMVANVKEGQKTLVDALSPASAALRESAEKGLSPAEAMRQAACAAEEGAQATANMIARKGRARFLGEKSLGHQDAGATSLAELVRLMAEFLENQEGISI